MQEIASWLSRRLPSSWYVSPPEFEVDSDEVLVIGDLTEPLVPEAASDEDIDEARKERIQRFRETTRDRRVALSREGEAEFGRRVSWGARCGGLEVLFSHLKAPATTRLGMRERRVVDALVDAGLARSRAEALAWCVRLAGAKESEWQAGGPAEGPDAGLTGVFSMAESLRELRSALTHSSEAED